MDDKNTAFMKALSELFETYEVVGAYRLVCAVFERKESMESFKRWFHIYSPETSKKIAGVLETLTTREQEVLIPYYGLTGDARSLEAVGNKFNVTRQRISQIKLKALRKMRHPTRTRKLWEVSDEVFLTTYIHDEKERKKMFPEKALELSVNELGLSIRALNGLNNANITTVGELVKKKESQMLMYRNFGKKSTGEIKQKLGGMGLSFADEKVRL